MTWLLIPTAVALLPAILAYAGYREALAKDEAQFPQREAALGH